MLFFKLQQWRGKTWFHALGYRRQEWKLRPKWRPSVAADRPPCVSWARWHLCAATPPRWRNPCPRDPWKPLAKGERGCAPMSPKSRNQWLWTMAFLEMCPTSPSFRLNFFVVLKIKTVLKQIWTWDILYVLKITNFGRCGVVR